MKKLFASIAITGLLLLSVGCASGTRPDNPGPLKTGQEIEPIKGCQDLRARGGSC